MFEHNRFKRSEAANRHKQLKYLKEIQLFTNFTIKNFRLIWKIIFHILYIV